MFHTKHGYAQEERQKMLRLELDIRNSLYRLSALIVVMKNELGLIPVSTHFFILKDPILIIGFRNLLECIEEWSLSSKKY